MKILLAHNFYKSSAPSGENIVYLSEVELLRSYGHQVITFEKHNDDFDKMSRLAFAVKASIGTIWSHQTYREMQKLLKKEKPDIAHFHNTFPQISPSAYYACKDEGVPVVQTLHNFRLFCANGLMFRKGKVCEDCIKFGSIMGIIHGCYRESKLFSTPVVASEYLQKALKTAKNVVSKFIALTPFSRDKFIEAGFPPEKFAVKPNFVKIQEQKNIYGDFIIFVGRLDRGKGMHTLIEASKLIPEISIHIVGDGPLKEDAIKSAGKNIVSHGLLPFEKTIELISGSKALLLPSLLYENFPRTILEAFALGKPVLASNLGNMAEIIKNESTGLLFPPGDAAALANACKRIMNEKGLAEKLGGEARKTYEKLYTPEKNYRQLMEIYKGLLG